MKYGKSLSFFALSLMLLGAGCSVAQTGGGGEAGAPPAGAVDGEWVASVDSGGIPSTPISGKINGESVDIASVIIGDWGDKFKWSFASEEASSTCGFARGSEVNLGSETLQTGTFMKALSTDVDYDTFNAYYVYDQADGVPMSINGDYEVTLVVTDYQNSVGEDDFGRNLGSAEGYMQITFDDGKTELAGAFTANVCEK